VLRGSKIVRPHEVLIIDLYDPKRERWGDSDGPTANACMTFSQFWGTLKRRLAQFEIPDTELPLETPKYVYTKHQFSSLFRIVHEQVERLLPRAIIIDNATYLDNYTVDLLMRVRDLHFPRCALILCARMERNATPDEPLRHIFKVKRSQKDSLDGLTDAQMAYLPEMVLSQVQELDFYKIVLEEVFASLEADLADDVVNHADSVAERLWTRTNQDWRVIIRIQGLLDLALGPEPQKRMVTMKLIEQVLEQL
jgi:hypothetical protein